MKILTKTEFLNLLKGVVNILESENIKYDIPYCHIDKDTYNYIDVMIIDNVTIFELSKMFNLSQIKEKDNIIYTTYQDFNINFIRTSTSDWGYVFNYYCWNVLPMLINTMVKPFNLQYSDKGLNYIHNNKKIPLTKNLKDIFELFELKFNLITLGFPTDFTIYSYVESSIYYDKKSFSLKTFKELDPMFEHNKNYYEIFLKHCPSYKLDPIDLDEQLENLDMLFPKAKLLEKISQIELKKVAPNVNFVEKINKEDVLNNLLKEKESAVKKLQQKRKINLKKLFSQKDKPSPKELDKGKGYEIDL